MTLHPKPIEMKGSAYECGETGASENTGAAPAVTRIMRISSDSMALRERIGPGTVGNYAHARAKCSSGGESPVTIVAHLVRRDALRRRNRSDWLFWYFLRVGVFDTRFPYGRIRGVASGRAFGFVLAEPAGTSTSFPTF